MLFEIFYNLLTVPRTVSNTSAQVAQAQPCANHVQHIERLSCASVSSAIKLDRVEIAFIWALFYWLNHLTDEGEEETGVPRENPWRRASENATYYSPKIQAPTETQPMQ